MAFPWVFEANFESGDNSEFNTETDTANQLDFPHYSELARFPWSGAVPFDGAYVMRCTLSGGTADATLTATDMNIAANTTNYVKFEIYIDPDFNATVNDTVNLLEMQQTSNAAEATFGLRYVAATNVINFGIGETAPTSWSALEIEKNVWYTIELAIDVENAGANDGTIDLYITKSGTLASSAVSATQVTSLDQEAITHGVLGIQGHLATTTGVILFNSLTHDDARIYPKTRRYDDTHLLTKSSHVFVGKGRVDNVTMLSGVGTNNILKIFDTDTADVTDATTSVLELANTANNETVDPAGVPVDLVRGCYVQLAGTNPRAIVKICRNVANSDATVRNQGMRR